MVVRPQLQMLTGRCLSEEKDKVAESTKEFPASEQKLLRLRRAGQVPFSYDVVTLGVVLGLSLGVFVFVKTNWPGLRSYWIQAFSATSATIDAQAGAGKSVAQATSETATAFFQQLLLCSIALLVPVIVVAFLFGWAQNRFLVTFQPVRLDLKRAFSSENILLGSLSRLPTVLATLVKAGAWTVLALILIGQLFSAETYGANISVFRSGNAGVDWHRLLVPETTQIIRLSIAAVIFCFFWALVSRFVVVLRFRLAQRMTRAEAEAEARESEPSGEMRRARREGLT